MHPGGILALQVLMILTDRWWPGSAAATLVRIASFSYVSIWLGLKIRRGYQRRRPHWTRESWLRYPGLAVMPVLALALTLLLSSIDTSSHVLGAPQSTTRLVAALTIIAMMVCGVIGLIAAIDWIESSRPAYAAAR